jgi:polyphosphate kinase
MTARSTSIPGGASAAAGAAAGSPAVNGQAGPAAAEAPAVARPDVGADSRFFNRDLSWLEFNRRVLSLAADESQPLLERVKFLSIYSSNLDEFVMKRVGWLRRRHEAGVAPSEYEPWPTGVLLSAVRGVIAEQQRMQARIFLESVRPALAAAGIHLLEYGQLTGEERAAVDRWFAREVFPVLTPLAVDPGHRFPFISNQSENLGVLVTEADYAEPLFARVKVPEMMPQWVRVPGGRDEGAASRGAGGTDPSASTAGDAGAGPRPSAAAPLRFVHLHDIIRHNLDDLFPGMRIVEVAHFRVIRNAEVEAEDEGENLLELVEAQLKQRRFARAVRLEISAGPSPGILRPLLEELRLGPEDVVERTGPLDYHDLLEIADLDRPDLREAPWRPVVPARLADREKDIFTCIREGDILVHHPYESFEASAQRFIAEAARDPSVLAIKQTIYRTSRDSPFVQSLIKAAESGKQVACLVELRARFDEQRNVRFAQMLEKAGVHVAYGVVGLKTHCKASLVIRREEDAGEGRPGVRAYAHLGTGNYHPRTAQQYTDLGLFTCNPEITGDVVDLFNFLTGRSLKDRYRSLLVAPVTMKARFLEMIEREMRLAREHAAGRSPVGGRIIAKMNAMEDRTVMQRLYDASAAGVDITLLVRGFCCLRPGVPGLSRTIRVRSIVGRFLEHSRIFYFGAGRADPVDGEYYISSADWMYRNLNNRVEAACPVLGREARARLAAVLDIMIRDRRCAWDLRPDGTYERPPEAPDAPEDSPERLGTFESIMRATAAGWGG